MGGILRFSGTLALISISASAQAPPVITSFAALRQVVNLGQTTSFTSTVTSTTPATYQWRRNGLPIPGATGSAYSLSGATPARHGGWYQMVVTNAAGSATSATMFLNVAVPVPQLVTWGFNDAGQLNVPAGLTNVTAVAAGRVHCLALKADGTVVAWGDNSRGQSTVPPGLANVVAIAAGNSGSLALRADGTVVGWGNVTVPVSLSGVVAIAADDHQLALKSDGTVVAWGDNTYGQTSVPSGLNNAIAVAVGGTNSLALRADGTVVAWGSNIYGQTNVPVGLNGVAAIALSDRSFALKADGSVVIWGVGLAVGQTRMPPGISGVAALSARFGGNLAMMALSKRGAHHPTCPRASGRLWRWTWESFTRLPCAMHRALRRRRSPPSPRRRPRRRARPPRSPSWRTSTVGRASPTNGARMGSISQAPPTPLSPLTPSAIPTAGATMWS